MVTSESALLIIDMQQGLFYGPAAPFAADSILSNITLLITKARQSEVPVFFARHIGPDNSPFNEQSPLTGLIPALQVTRSQMPSSQKNTPAVSGIPAYSSSLSKEASINW